MTRVMFGKVIGGNLKAQVQKRMFLSPFWQNPRIPRWEVVMDDEARDVCVPRKSKFKVC